MQRLAPPSWCFLRPALAAAKRPSPSQDRVFLLWRATRLRPSPEQKR